MERNFLTYEQFGAVGDGVHDDIDAIVACHNEANLRGLAVRARDGANYYIGGSDKTAVIKTDVDFGCARFTIDDSALENPRSFVFSVESDFEFEPFEIQALSAKQKAVGVSFSGNYLVRVQNDNQPVFIRKGLNKNDGIPTQDVFVVDKEGVIYPSVNFDYPKITLAEKKCIDDAPIILSGGIFTTVANQHESVYKYHWRGFHVTRAHVKFKGFKHFVSGEGICGAPYHGFVHSDFAVDLTIEDCLVTPRRTYRTESKIPGKMVPMGSYDLSFRTSIDVRCVRVMQSVDINDLNYWGVYTSNLCKNLYLEGCVLSRFDAHMGVTNFKIRNSRLGHQGIQLIGFGEGRIEDSEITSGAVFALRPDYGATWTGNITIKNCIWNPTGTGRSIFYSINEENHDFGYLCTEPSTLTIDGLYVNDEDFGDEPLYIAPKYRGGDGESAHFKYGTTREIYIKNLKSSRGAKVEICSDPHLYLETNIIYEK